MSPAFLFQKRVSLYPFQIHSIFLSSFASLIGPFGGFFASGFKRAFKIKVIPANPETPDVLYTPLCEQLDCLVGVLVLLVSFGGLHSISKVTSPVL